MIKQIYFSEYLFSGSQNIVFLFASKQQLNGIEVDVSGSKDEDTSIWVET